MKCLSAVPLPLLFFLVLSACDDVSGSGDDASTSDAAPGTSDDTTSASDPATTEPGTTTDATDPINPGSTTAASTSDETTAGDETADPPGYDGSPLFDDVETLTLDIEGDETDVYLPADDGSFPVAVMLQGANVDKQYYSGLASTVARYGFVVAVPNHLSSGFMGEGLFMEQGVITDVIAGLDGAPDLDGRVDVSAVGLMGHSYGGVVGMYALTDQCTPPFCEPPFDLPASVRGGAFYGTNMRPPFGGAIAALPNAGRGITLIQGTVDGAATPPDGLETFEALQTPPAAYVTLLGANHYGNCDVNNPEGAAPDNNAPTLDQAQGLETVSRFAGVSLRAWILDDAEARTYLQTAVDPNVVITLSQ
jgi:dienelactone hydrolase